LAALKLTASPYFAGACIALVGRQFLAPDDAIDIRS